MQEIFVKKSCHAGYNINNRGGTKMINVAKLENGLQILTENDDHAKTLTLSYVVKCGSYNEDKSNLGIAHFTEHMLFKGTTNRNSVEISEYVEKIGGILNAETSFQHTKYYCTVPAESWKTGIDIISDLVWNNLIPEEEFEREKQVVLEELKMYEDNASAKACELLNKKMFNSSVNRQLIGGTLESVKAITRDQMISFIDKNYTPKNIFVVATGNINHNELVEFIKNYMEDVELISNNDISVEEFTPGKSDGKDEVLSKDINQSHLCWGSFGPRPSDKDYVVGEVISTLLGGNASSRLYQIIREQQGLAYTVSMDCEPVFDLSILNGYVGLDKENIPNVKKVISEQFDILKKELVSEEELQKAKSYIRGTVLIAFERTSSKNRFICESILNNIDTDLDKYLKEIDNVISDDIKNFAVKYFNTDNIYFSEIISK
jgi:predicted Zn-dependent peptidase